MLDNAIKFTATDGVSVRLYRDARGLPCIAEKDTGVGIEERYQGHLFEPFRQEEFGPTRSYEGAGLGLALTRSYLELNDARITCASRKGVGTTFTVSFNADVFQSTPPPIAPVPLTPIRAAREREQRPVIMVVEDDLDNLLLMELLLKHRFDVLPAASADEVRRIIETRREPIDLVLMDLSLDDADDGLKLTRMLRGTRRFSHTPVVAITGHSKQEDRDRAIAFGCDAFVTKPIERALLFEVIDRLLRDQPQAAAGPEKFAH